MVSFPSHQIFFELGNLQTAEYFEASEFCFISFRLLCSDASDQLTSPRLPVSVKTQETHKEK